MNFPLDLTIFGTKISTHLVAEIFAFFIGYRFYSYKKRESKENFTSEQRLIILIAAASGALIFSRVIGALENLSEWKSAPNFWLYLYGSKTVVGGFLGGWLCVEIVKKWMKLTESSGDLMVYPIIIALIIGRIGCFSQGIHEMTYGYPTESVFGMNLGDGILRHPLALYEIVVLLIIALFLFLMQRTQPFPNGIQFKVFMILYITYRFIVEWMKPHFPLYFGLTSIQISIVIAYLLNGKFFIQWFQKKMN